MTRIDLYKKHIKNISNLDDIGWKMINCYGFPQEPCYHRNQDRGWWMVMKEIIVLKYVQIYLSILSKQPQRELFFIDFLSSNGMCELSLSDTKENLYLPGSTLIAAAQNYTNIHKFDKIFANDFAAANREALIKRLDVLNKTIIKTMGKPEIKYSIPHPDRGEIDSNQIIDEFMLEIGKSYFSHYLALIDNENMNIEMETIKRMRESPKGEFGDVIINYPIVSIDRELGKANSEKYSDDQREKIWTKINSFYGKDMRNIPKKQFLKEYLAQLKETGLTYHEHITVRSGDSRFYYDLIFLVRERPEGADWLNHIKLYRNNEFKDLTGKDIKRYWKRIYGTEITLFNFNKDKKKRTKYRHLEV